MEILTRIQKLLFVVGSNLATDQSNTELKAASVVHAEDIMLLENEIDTIDESLPQLRAFVLPGGCQASSQCHVCRTVCRRAERRILSLGRLTLMRKSLKYFGKTLADDIFLCTFAAKLKQGQNN